MGYAEAVAELFPYRPRLTARIMRLAERFPGTMWQDDAHRKRMETLRLLLLGCRKERDTPEFFAALYLLTSNQELADRTFNCFFRSGIDFRYARRRGISPHDYTLLMAAKSLYCHTAEVTQGDLAEPQIIPDEAFRLLINALLIARFGLDALKITARRGQREYTLRRLIRREAGGNAPSAGLLFPLRGGEHRGSISRGEEPQLHGHVQLPPAGYPPDAEIHRSAVQDALPDRRVGLYHPWACRHLQRGRGRHRRSAQGTGIARLPCTPPAQGQPRAHHDTEYTIYESPHPPLPDTAAQIRKPVSGYPGYGAAIYGKACAIK